MLFNLDPCGYTDFNLTTLQDIMKSFKKVEIFYTCMIGALLQYTRKQKGDGRDSRDDIEKNIKKLLDVPLENFLEAGCYGINLSGLAQQKELYIKNLAILLIS